MPDSRKPKSAKSPKPDPNPPPVHNFLKSLGEVLLDITALEVSTIVVNEITPHKFIPRQTYQELYPLCAEFLKDAGIHRSLVDHYLQLHRTLLLRYIALIADPQSPLYNPQLIDAVQESYQLLSNPANDAKEIPLQLPDPSDPRKADQLEILLSTASFLRCLRKLSEIKATLDQRNFHAQKNLDSKEGEQLLDIIYARTVVQLDGDVLNSYNQKLFQNPQQQAILQIHQAGVAAAQHHWQGLLEFVIYLAQRAFPKKMRK
ncbi:MAG: hypothetical protein HC916_12555 [Coleofasciculaceae cyanobacterium SM2_1_6]|nr:hypothetical protein [Coleofasciculaceae cyanobacterium SM2_1_6]